MLHEGIKQIWFLFFTLCSLSAAKEKLSRELMTFHCTYVNKYNVQYITRPPAQYICMALYFSENQLRIKNKFLQPQPGFGLTFKALILCEYYNSVRKISCHMILESFTKLDVLGTLYDPNRGDCIIFTLKVAICQLECPYFKKNYFAKSTKE